MALRNPRSDLTAAALELVKQHTDGVINTRGVKWVEVVLDSSGAEVAVHEVLYCCELRWLGLVVPWWVDHNCEVELQLTQLPLMRKVDHGEVAIDHLGQPNALPIPTDPTTEHLPAY